MSRRKGLALIVAGAFALSAWATAQEPHEGPVDDLLPEWDTAAPETIELNLVIPSNVIDLAQRELNRAMREVERAVPEGLAAAQLALAQARRDVSELLAQADRAEARSSAGVSASVNGETISLLTLSGGIAGGGLGGPMLIPFAPLAPEAYFKLSEDIAVLARILDKRMEDLLGGDYTKGGGMVYALVSPFMREQRIQSVYLGGYGLILTTSVRFALTPSLEASPEGEKPNTVWEQTRRELYEGQPSFREKLNTHAIELVWGDRQPYDAEKVARLKSALASAVKEASNLRQIGPEEWITVVVFGPADLSKSTAAVRDERSDVVIADVRQLTSQPTMLAVRLRKNMVDNFASGNLDEAWFWKNAEVFAR